MVSLSPSWEQFRYHEGQSRLWRSKSRIKAVPAGRGSGKSALAKRYVVRWLPNAKPWRDVKYFYGLPTYKRAKKIAWYDILNLIPRDWILGKPNVSDMVINTIFGSQIYVLGLDQPERLEGVQWDGGILDECCDLKLDQFLYPGLMPAMSHKFGWLWMIGVPKRSGPGANEFKDICDLGMQGGTLEGTNDKIETFTWKSDTVLSEEQLAFFKHHMDERDYAEQFDATWQSVGGAIFHEFDKLVHVKDSVIYDPSKVIHVASDFNVNPMCWCLSHIYDGKIYTFDELFLRNTNTPKTLDILYERYGQHKSGFRFYGDATARSRRPSAVFTDYAHIVRDERFDDPIKKKVYYLPKNPSVSDRFAACNAMFKNAAGEVRAFIHPRCRYLIKDGRNRSYKKGTREADDILDSDMGHMSDAWGYKVFRLFPIRIKKFEGDPKVSVSSHTNRIMQFS